MKFQLLTAAFAATAAAVPALRTRQSNGTTIGDNEPFGLMALRSGSAIHFSSFSASQNGIQIGLDSQGASCDSTDSNDATFYLSNGALYLLTPSNITQELYTDRSGMGQGVLQYSTTPGGYQAGRNSETTGWVIDAAGDLTFDGADFIACPNSIDDAWSAWISAGVSQPGGSTGCVGVVARTVKAVQTPAVCTYSYTPVSA
ncbi:hypothetical protein VM1G_11039 [Cytospora mali]|nr:hypothetical protein VM1G_11039 [Valsa mali]